MAGRKLKKDLSLTKNSLRIAMLSVHSSPIGKLGTRDTGGMSVYIRDVARELGQLGHAVDIYTARPGGSGEAIMSLGQNVNLIQLTSGNGRHTSEAFYRQVPKFFQELDAFRNQHAIDYDLIHSHYWLSGCLGKMAQERWERPHVINFHTLAAVKNSIGIGKLEPAIRLTTERQQVRECHRIISATEREREQLNRFYDAAPEKVAIVPCGVNLKVFRPMGTAAARQELGYACGDSILLYVGRFEPLKGIDRLLEATAVLKRRKNVQVIIVGGDGPRTAEERRLRKVVRDLGLQNHVKFVGRVEQRHLPIYYSAADALVVPSHYESFGLVALESLACGTPVVATPVGAVNNILKEGCTGFVVKAVNSQSLAAGIGRLLFTPETEKTLLGRDEIRETIRHYGWSAIAATLSEEYTRICNSGGMT